MFRLHLLNELILDTARVGVGSGDQPNIVLLRITALVFFLNIGI